MFYRQKVLLALLQCFGGSLGHTDLEKLLLFYCKKTGQNHYDFFPYKFGAFSFVSFYDKQKLVKKGLLKDVNIFEVKSTKSYIEGLEVKDRAALRSFAREFSNLRGNELIRASYLAYPEYALRSEIVHQVLNTEEYGRVESNWQLDNSIMFFTIGYEGISIDEYLFRLLSHNIKMLIDVRKNPLSRKHGFSKKQLQSYVEKTGIIYHHMPDLGIPSHMRKNLNSTKSYTDLFDYYAEEILPKQDMLLEEIKEDVRKHKRVAITCFEADYHFCHRCKISLAIEKDSQLNAPVTHI